jgi:LPS export ABC transporter protein LptC
MKLPLRTSWLIFNLLEIILLISLLGLNGCRKVTEPSKARINPNYPDEQSSFVHIVSMKGDSIDYILDASRIDRFYDKKNLVAFDVNIISYDKSGKVHSTMSAKKAMVDDIENRIAATGHVKLITTNGILQTEALTWERSFDEIVAPGNVTLIRNGNILQGISLRTDSNLNYAEMKQVTATGTANEKDLNW